MSIAAACQNRDVQIAQWLRVEATISGWRESSANAESVGVPRSYSPNTPSMVDECTSSTRTGCRSSFQQAAAAVASRRKDDKKKRERQHGHVCIYVPALQHLYFLRGTRGKSHVRIFDASQSAFQWLLATYYRARREDHISGRPSCDQPVVFLVYNDGSYLINIWIGPEMGTLSNHHRACRGKSVT